MKLLAIDRGNSRTKVGLYTSEQELEVVSFPNNEMKELMDFLQTQSFQGSILSSVASQNMDEVIEHLHVKSTFILMSASTSIPISNSYATPDTLGTDRIAGAIGAWKLARKRDVLLVDAGTCVNYECVVNNHYLGGAISPGLQMRLKSMHEYTGKLPLPVLTNNEVSVIGNSTETCLLSGACNGLAMEINGMASFYNAQFPGITGIITGGDSSYLGKYLKNSIFAPHKEIAITGLIEILKHNLDVE